MGGCVYGILVGIDRYRPPVPPLNGCVNDIDSIVELLENFNRGGDFKLDLRTLKNSEATRDNIISGFRNHLRQAGPEDIALFYYSGHGSQESAPSEFWHLEPDRLNETLVCYDSRTAGGWDLADKELALLIAEVAKKRPHILCVLDCCHSGSGTRASVEDGIAIRRAPTDRRDRPIDSFLDGVLEAHYTPQRTDPDSNWSIVPEGRHVLFAACRSNETAKEIMEDSRPHGAFTACLLSALSQTHGSINYRDLLKRVEAQVRLRVSQQAPQIEASTPDELQRNFLGDASRVRQSYFTLRFDRDLDWVIDGGAIHGIPQAKGDETTAFAIYGLDSEPSDWQKVNLSIATAEVIEVRPELSKVKVQLPSVEPRLNQKSTYRAITLKTPLPPLEVHLSGDRSAVECVRQALSDRGLSNTASLLVREADSEGSARLQVKGTVRSYQIARSGSERPTFAEVEGQGKEAAQLVVDRLEHFARWDTVAKLQNNDGRLGRNPVKLTIYVPVSNATEKKWQEVDQRNDIRLYYCWSGTKWVQPRIRIELTNTSQYDLYVALLWLGDDFSIDSGLMRGGAVHIPAGQSMSVNGGKDVYASVPEQNWREGRTETTDLLKAIVSTEQFDPTLFDQAALDHYVLVRGTKGFGTRALLDRLAAKVHDRALSTQPDDGEVNAGWATSDLALTVVRPLNGTGIPSKGQQADLGANVTLLGHPALKAKVSLVSSTEAGRSLEHLIIPPIFRDDPDVSQPLVFESARGSDPGLGVILLEDVENPESVTASEPLKLQARMPLGPGERAIPFAWDGEFFLPLGIVRQSGDTTEIELKQLPVSVRTTRDLERGIASSIRILFQKFAYPYLGLDFDYPRLAAVDFKDATKPSYHGKVDDVRERVARAGKVLLYIHGILGDTFGMTASAQVDTLLSAGRTQKVADHYDLILAFDYENINTGIATTAKTLKERLAAVGLGPGHGKTFHIAAHSMGGLVARWFIEREGGNEIVQHLVTLGTPHAGSPWPTIQGWATAALAIGINGMAQVAWPLKLLGDLVGAAETVDVTLDEMDPRSAFLSDLAGSPNPSIPYTLLVGNTSIIPAAIANGRLEALLGRLAPQRVLHSAAGLAFLRKPNDIAVSALSAQAVAKNRVPAPRVVEVGCDHITFFNSRAGLQILLEALIAAHGPL